MKLTNVESGVITNQRMGEGGALNTGLTDAIDDAWEQSDVEFGQPTDGRIPEGQRTSTGTGGSGGSDAPGGQQSSPEVGGPPGRSASGERGRVVRPGRVHAPALDGRRQGAVLTATGTGTVPLTY
jgi:hypothetical protein